MKLFSKTFISSFCLVMSQVLNPLPSAFAAEDDYQFDWLDSDKKIYVLQNRKFRKENRLMISALGGFNTSAPYRNAYNGDGRITYYFLEDWGVEALYMHTFNSLNNNANALGRETTVVPMVREIRDQFAGLIHWAPWYAKINVFNTILYFDWYFSAGAGSIMTALDTNRDPRLASNYKRETFLGLYLGTGHQYHVTKNLVVRLDFLGTFYQAQKFGNTGGSTWFSNYNFNMGLGWRF